MYPLTKSSPDINFLPAGVSEWIMSEPLERAREGSPSWIYQLRGECECCIIDLDTV